MAIIQVGLVDTTGKLDPELVQSTASALNIQVMRDLPQFWNIQATVTYLPHASKLPVGRRKTVDRSTGLGAGFR